MKKFPLYFKFINALLLRQIIIPIITILLLGLVLSYGQIYSFVSKFC